MADSFLSSFRRLCGDVVTEQCTPPVYRYLPDDPAHLPVLVVGRPSAIEGQRSSVMRMSLDITLLGRRISDDDSQAELDAYADELWFAFGGTRGINANGEHLAARSVQPGTVIVAALEFPAYTVVVTADVLSC